MRLKFDEHLPVEAAEIFRAAGHDAATVVDQALEGADDERLVEVCRNEDRALVTFDLDFSDLRAYPPNEYPGILVIRLKDQSKPVVLALMERLAVLVKDEAVTGTLWIVDEDHVRIRGGAER